MGLKGEGPRFMLFLGGSGLPDTVPWPNVGALIIRIGFWGPICYNYNQEPQNNIGNCLGPYTSCFKGSP